MRFKPRPLILSLLTIALLVSAPFAATTYATNTAPAAKPGQPDPMANPLLAGLINAGAKVFYLGNRSGLDGWFILKDYKIQIAYITADGETMAVGALYDKAGNNVTGDQINKLAASDKNFMTVVNEANKEAGAIAGNAPATAADAVPPPGTLPSAPASLGEKLFQDLNKSLNVEVGGNNAAPEILMVFDPECSYCHDVWKQLRTYVAANTLRVKLIPVVTLGTANESEAEALLTAADPLGTWNKYVDGSKAALAFNATPDPAMVANLRANHLLIDQWSIKNLPFIMYRAKDGKVKIVQGKIADATAIVQDLP